MDSFLSRRRFLASTATLGVAAYSALGFQSVLPRERVNTDERRANEPAMEIVDTHQHLWDLTKLRLPWLSDPKEQDLRRSFLLKDYDEATSGVNVVKTIYMEVTCDAVQQDAEAEYVIGICRTPGSRMRGAVIGGSPNTDGFARYVLKYADNQYVKGVRTVLNDPDRPKGMCLEPRFVESVRLVGRLGMSFDLCMRPAELMDGVRLMDKCPDTRFIIDHCGCMDVQASDPKVRAAWEQGMKAAAKQQRAICKISGLVATAKPKVWQPSDLEPIVNFCLDTFGEDHVVFGSDWPVCNRTASYKQWVDALQWIVRNRSAKFRRKLFHDNAIKFYKLT
jgi:predicted TIM-barrel fold metal-dependent hydrolase